MNKFLVSAEGAWSLTKRGPSSSLPDPTCSPTGSQTAKTGWSDRTGELETCLQDPFSMHQAATQYTALFVVLLECMCLWTGPDFLGLGTKMLI